VPVTPPRPEDVHVFRHAGEFRRWLARNHDSVPALFVGYYKKGVPKSAMTYVQAVEEALCFGWIDGITYRMDDELTASRFTPRRRGSNWSASNIARIATLKAAGRLQPAGLRAFEERDPRRDASYSYEQPPAQLEPSMRAQLEGRGAAAARWAAEQPSFRRTATHWVTSAKRVQTRERRFAQLLDALDAGTRPRPFLVERRERENRG
jgi:uncharacterized protein YdeI (YjbR/CyaY-like superfamily)